MTQKPSWSEAPEWANYIVMGADGLWLWTEFKPKSEGWLNGGIEYAKVAPAPFDWESTLEERPA